MKFVNFNFPERRTIVSYSSMIVRYYNVFKSKAIRVYLLVASSKLDAGLFFLL